MKNKKSANITAITKVNKIQIQKHMSYNCGGKIRNESYGI